MNESTVLEALVRVGPLSIAGTRARGCADSYKGGVDVPPPTIRCPYFCCYPEGNSYSALDHEVLLVGFGEEGGVPYGKIKKCAAAVRRVAASRGYADSGGRLRSSPRTRAHVVAHRAPSPRSARSSWGPRWGEDGFFRVARGMNSVGVACDVIGVAAPPAA